MAKIAVTPGARYRVSFEGVIILREGKPVLQTDRGIFALDYPGAKIEMLHCLPAEHDWTAWEFVEQSNEKRSCKLCGKVEFD